MTTADAEKTVISVISYGPGEFAETTVQSLSEIPELLKHGKVKWINVDGPVDLAAVEEIGKQFNLHPLALKHVVNTRQRAKYEEFGKHHFLVCPMVKLGEKVETEQLSLFFGEGFVVTYQELPGGDCLGPVRERIRAEIGKIRNLGADHLASMILDAVVDGYFPVLESLGEKLEDLEEDILERHDTKAPKRIHAIKRDVINLRRCIFPLREALHTLVRDASPTVSAETRLYLRDCYDHAFRILDLVEMDRELCSDLMDLHHSASANRMNEVMKVLAIITTLFIPPTFVAGIYGMNFHSDKSPWNMPELSWAYGYPLALLSMLLIMVGLLLWMRSKGWLEGVFNFRGLFRFRFRFSFGWLLKPFKGKNK